MNNLLCLGQEKTYFIMLNLLSFLVSTDFIFFFKFHFLNIYLNVYFYKYLAKYVVLFQFFFFNFTITIR